MEEQVLEKAKKVRLLILDVDGVLTDGRIIYDSQGRDLKLFDVHDGLGVYILKKAGIPTVIVTAKGSKAIRPRARDMCISAVFQNISPKSAVLEKILKRFKVKPEEICFIADDLVDLCLIKKVGFKVAVFNASSEIKKACDYVTFKHGGRGAVREVSELILKAQKKWQEAVSAYDI
ncbi:MAG: 3-deoxy-D-manno-octulosonate 8-phosphate phosphatase [Candidatus Omnitrophota bacterium]|nr:MAG: 3-deoxy-D-manno-octulosonate 8-phosphate phosphatase [Candidatus Omnitrophota bacterium]